MAVRIERLSPGDVSLIARIDRSEHVEVAHAVRDGMLVQIPVPLADIPAWDPDATGGHSIAAQIAFCQPILQAGATFLGAFDGDDLAGLAIVDPDFEPPMAWLAWLHVSRPHRRRGAATALWAAAADIARGEGATRMYVSATETGSAVGFYLCQGCQLADPVHADLFALEPEDIHLTCEL